MWGGEMNEGEPRGEILVVRLVVFSGKAGT